MARDSKRLENEIQHGKYIVHKGEQIWNWSSPAGKIRWTRRVYHFKEFLGDNNKRVLEIGCGTGLFTNEISKSCNDIVSVDISQDLLDLARIRVTAENVVFLCENAYQTTFEDNSFDFIVGSSCLHHLDIDKALAEFYRLLKSGGSGMFTEPNMLNPQIALQKNIPFIKKMAGDSPDETAFIRWGISRKLRQVGFKEVSVVPFDFVHPSIPLPLLKSAVPILNALERIPLVKEIAGSLIIKFKK